MVHINFYKSPHDWFQGVAVLSPDASARTFLDFSQAAHIAEQIYHLVEFLELRGVARLPLRLYEHHLLGLVEEHLISGGRLLHGLNVPLAFQLGVGPLLDSQTGHELELLGLNLYLGAASERLDLIEQHRLGLTIHIQIRGYWIAKDSFKLSAVKFGSPVRIKF